jgi:hypothetical protein
VTYTPILLGEVLKATGKASPMTVPAKGHYMATELCGVGQRAIERCFQTKSPRVRVGHASADARCCGGTKSRVFLDLPLCDLADRLGRSAEPWR